MRYQGLYEQCLESIPARIRKCYDTGKRTAIGYTSNLDQLMCWDSEAFNTMAEAYLVAEPSFVAGEMIRSVPDLLRIVCYLILHGLGGEIDITSAAVCAELEKRFIYHPALGGTCAQGAAALANVGIPVIAQISDRSEAVCGFLDYPEISLVSPEGGLVSVAEMISEEEPVKHFILQYAKGDQIRIGNDVHRIPLSNRIILDYDGMHKTLPVDPHFLTYVEEHAADMHSYSISGFNAIISPRILHQTVEEMAEHYRRVKERNSSCILYLESAHYFNTDSRHVVYEGFAPFLDILGMNEEELADLAEHCGQLLLPEDADSLLAALEKAHEAYPARGLVVHSKDYAIYYGQPACDIDMEAALCLGNLLSGTRARIGRYGGLKDCRETLETPLSPVGVELASHIPQTHHGRSVYIVPSRYMENPVATIGLGDTFVAGMLAAMIR